MNQLKKFIVSIEHEKIGQKRSSLINNMYYHIFSNGLVDEIGKVNIAKQLESFIKQGEELMFWQAKLVEIEYVPENIENVQNTVKTLCLEIDAETDQEEKAKKRYVMMCIVSSYPQLFMLGINREKFMDQLRIHEYSIQKYIENSVEDLADILNGTTFKEDSIPELIPDPVDDYITGELWCKYANTRNIYSFCSIFKNKDLKNNIYLEDIKNEASKYLLDHWGYRLTLIGIHKIACSHFYGKNSKERWIQNPYLCLDNGNTFDIFFENVDNIYFVDLSDDDTEYILDWIENHRHHSKIAMLFNDYVYGYYEQHICDEADSEYETDSDEESDSYEYETDSDEESDSYEYETDSEEESDSYEYETDSEEESDSYETDSEESDSYETDSEESGSYETDSGESSSYEDIDLESIKWCGMFKYEKDLRDLNTIKPEKRKKLMAYFQSYLDLYLNDFLFCRFDNETIKEYSYQILSFLSDIFDMSDTGENDRTKIELDDIKYVLKALLGDKIFSNMEHFILPISTDLKMIASIQNPIPEHVICKFINYSIPPNSKGLRGEIMTIPETRYLVKVLKYLIDKSYDMYETDSEYEKDSDEESDSCDSDSESYEYETDSDSDSYEYETESELDYSKLVCNLSDLKALLEDFSVNTLDIDGETLLMNAVRWRQDETVLYLCNRGDVNMNTQNLAGKTALHMTCGKLHQDKWSYAPLLVDKGADPSIKSFAGKDTMFYAIQRYAYSTIRALKMLCGFNWFQHRVLVERMPKEMQHVLCD